MTSATILIPAHNEASVIGRTLWFLSRGMPLNEYEVIIIANGCTDATATRARAVLPQALVLETEQAGKCNALNLGYSVRRGSGPVICLDADLDVTSESLSALIAPVREGSALAACGQMDVATSHASLAVRSFYRGWRINPYFNRGKFGGLFVLDRVAAERLFPLPEVTADDEFIRRSFAPGDIASVPACTFTARAPATLRDLVKVRRRSIRGTREIASLGLPRPEGNSLPVLLKHAFSKPADAGPVLVFLTVMIWVRMLLAIEGNSQSQVWERDLSSRVAG
ncbi:MAG: glycosyltransferase [Rhodobacteraceae bacterium]|nr:glycosyltransferase [Paracoccaceae bacterium]